jgi:hypothetical protein
MPNPREAIFDVIKAKFERSKEQKRLEEAWRRYEEDNAVANGKAVKREH